MIAKCYISLLGIGNSPIKNGAHTNCHIKTIFMTTIRFPPPNHHPASLSPTSATRVTGASGRAGQLSPKASLKEAATGNHLHQIQEPRHVLTTINTNAYMFGCVQPTISAEEFAAQHGITPPNWLRAECEANPHFEISDNQTDGFQWVELYAVPIEQCKELLGDDIQSSPLATKDGQFVLLPTNPFNESPEATPWAQKGNCLSVKALCHLSASRSMVFFDEQGKPSISVVSVVKSAWLQNQIEGKASNKALSF
jgi:hypothetical protein